MKGISVARSGSGRKGPHGSADETVVEGRFRVACRSDDPCELGADLPGLGSKEPRGSRVVQGSQRGEGPAGRGAIGAQAAHGGGGGQEGGDGGGRPGPHPGLRQLHRRGPRAEGRRLHRWNHHAGPPAAPPHRRSHPGWGCRRTDDGRRHQHAPADSQHRGGRGSQADGPRRQLQERHRGWRGRRRGEDPLFSPGEGAKPAAEVAAAESPAAKEEPAEKEEPKVAEEARPRPPAPTPTSRRRRPRPRAPRRKARPKATPG